MLGHFLLSINLSVVSRNKRSTTSWVKSSPLLVLTSELQESFDDVDFTLSSYLSVKGKLHIFDGRSFYLSVVLVRGLVSNSCIYVGMFSVPFGGICSSHRSLSCYAAHKHRGLGASISQNSNQ